MAPVGYPWTGFWLLDATMLDELLDSTHVATTHIATNCDSVVHRTDAWT
jgi:hypothetical protein